MKDKTYFSLSDGSDYFFAGRNSATKEQCIDAGIDFMCEDEDEDDIEVAKSASYATKEHLLMEGGYFVKEHIGHLSPDVKCSNCGTKFMEEDAPDYICKRKEEQGLNKACPNCGSSHYNDL